MKVYDKTGVEFDKDGVDAKECVAIMGWSLYAPGEKAEKAEQPEIAKTVAEIKAELDAAGIGYSGVSGKANLMAILKESS